MILISTWFGTFLAEDGEVVKHVLFPRDPQVLARNMMKMEERKALREERELTEGLAEFFVTERRLEALGGVFTTESPPFLKAEDYGFDTSMLREAMIALGRLRMKRAVQPADHIIQAVRTLDDMTHTANLLMERLRDWYSLHFPELTRMVEPGDFLEMVAEYGRREEMPLKGVESMGADMDSIDVRAIQSLAEEVKDVHHRRSSLEAYIEEKIGSLAPNIAHLVGPIIGARLLSFAGGLDELARMPASTIQLLGAEKALFRHLRKGTRPPKHGVLFQHPWIHKAPYWQRGPIARGLAAKLAIAARADAFTGRFVGEELKADAEALIQKVRKTHQRPPERPRRKARKKPGRRR